MMILDVNTFNEHHKNKNGSDAYEVKKLREMSFLSYDSKNCKSKVGKKVTVLQTSH